MRVFLKRLIAASAVLVPAGVLGSGAVSPTRAESGSHQYFVGTHGESCSSSCQGERFICCRIVIEPET
jgi:hypothetical protein